MLLSLKLVVQMADAVLLKLSDLLSGTKWCGLGDEARNYHDLGDAAHVDICCRAHDHCPVRLKALHVDYGVINLSPYTIEPGDFEFNLTN